jgi:hypothetical protein
MVKTMMHDDAIIEKLNHASSCIIIITITINYYMYILDRGLRRTKEEKVF